MKYLTLYVFTLYLGLTIKKWEIDRGKVSSQAEKILKNMNGIFNSSLTDCPYKWETWLRCLRFKFRLFRLIITKANSNYKPYEYQLNRQWEREVFIPEHTVEITDTCHNFLQLPALNFFKVHKIPKIFIICIENFERSNYSFLALLRQI